MADSFPEFRDILQRGNLPADTSQFSEACQKRYLSAALTIFLMLL